MIAARLPVDDPPPRRHEQGLRHRAGPLRLQVLLQALDRPLKEEIIRPLPLHPRVMIRQSGMLLAQTARPFSALKSDFPFQVTVWAMLSVTIGSQSASE